MFCEKQPHDRAAPFGIGDSAWNFSFSSYGCYAFECLSKLPGKFVACQRRRWAALKFLFRRRCCGIIKQEYKTEQNDDETLVWS